jgi:tRNA threonylcarbamoyladenosine biosynthesis protein TsaB
MMVLGIDTATAVASVGLIRDGEPLAEESRPAVPGHMEILLPLISVLLARANASLAELSGIGVSIGPGSFTGLRVALGTVKGFAYALGHRVVGVPTLEALARTVKDWEGIVCPLLDARKREVYAALFRRDSHGRLERLTPDLALTPQSLLERITAPCLFLGDGVETYGELLRKRCKSAALVLPFSSHHPRGVVVARSAWERLCLGEQEDLQGLTPRYVRLPEAELKRRDLPALSMRPPT